MSWRFMAAMSLVTGLLGAVVLALDVKVGGFALAWSCGFAGATSLWWARAGFDPMREPYEPPKPSPPG